MAERFNYESLFSAGSRDAPPGNVRHSKYDFAVAYPDPDLLPLDGLVEAVKSGLDREGWDLAYYSSPSGDPELRRLVAEKLSRDRNMKVTADDLVLTSGSGEAIGIVIQALTDPGDVVLVEEFVYLGTLNQMRRYGADVVGVRCDDGGIIPEDLDAVITEQLAKGKKVKYLYTIPAFQNPLGWTMGLERREQVLDVTGKHGIPVFEDDCYADLRFEGEDVTSFHSLDDTGRVVYVGSFSKIIAPGMRMGYLVAPKEVIGRAWSFKSGGAVSQFTALTIAEYMKGGLNHHIEEQNRALAAKRDAMVAALGENFGSSVEWTAPQGGLYVWVRFPEGTDLAAVQEEIFDEGVSYYNGSQFSPTGEGSNCVRLCFGHPTVETIRDGIAEFARILDRRGILPR
ncbi:MAG: PLP-dependent aminotransferase family protein [Chloroflexi bacterium]|nr:PLP-dependent aminotransferase family protein [Chloroflexota bacterium]MDA1270082.1 PLP-dependent aminotransferase family protein [Chloroflexota bacterium]